MAETCEIPVHWCVCVCVDVANPRALVRVDVANYVAIVKKMIKRN